MEQVTGGGSLDVRSLVSSDGSRVNRRVLTDLELYDREMREIFGRCWVYVGHESEIAAPGDFISSYLGPQPVIVSRGDDGEVHVVLNTCRHRAAKVCRSDRGCASSFTCANHGWTYRVDGTLLRVPHQRDFGSALDPAEFGLAAARTESYHQLIFATLDHDGPSLRDYLGDAAFYLDLVFGRPGGTELVGGVQKWMIPCNWKLPPENQAPDLYHAETAHASIYSATGADVREYVGDLYQSVTTEGHTLCFRRLPGAFPTDDEILEAADSPEDHDLIRSYLADEQAATVARYGAERGNLEVVAGTVFPNFSFISNIFNIRMSQPRGISQIEMRSWCFVPADAPPEVKVAMRRIYATTFGPAGMVESDDCENWMSMTQASQSPLSETVPFFLGMGLGEEFTDDRYPGELSTSWSEHAMRGYWRNWLKWLGARS
jgi:phenylpropionate dioxygenase-like ring-hydroxylating dioxygenase large terminal subunit